MRTRTLIGIVAFAAAAFAGSQNDLAAVYVALGAGAILYVLHTVEVKLNRLLDDARVFVSDEEIRRE